MTEWGIDTLFNPGKRHMDEEKRRLQSTREEIGDSSGGRRIDLESGVVRIARKNSETDDTETDDAETDRRRDRRPRPTTPRPTTPRPTTPRLTRAAEPTDGWPNERGPPSRLADRLIG